MTLHKDETLDRLANTGNVAQFVSFRPQYGGLTQTFCRIVGYQPNFKFASTEEAIEALLASSSDQSVNIRSYVPDSPRSKEFVYGLKSVEEVIIALQRLADSQLHLIVNETIDVKDGGVSGVIQGDVAEFAPDDTPRCVEKPGVASLPFPIAMRLLEIVYGIVPDLEARSGIRTEFSIHPKPRGYRQTHTIVWEHETDVIGNPRPSFAWPNRFSRHIGDKAFGLLMAHLLGLSVPKTLVIGRRVAPFSFGNDTGSKVVWTRTCPSEPQPGLYTTVKGWTDPFKLLSGEDETGSAISSVLCQSGVLAHYSGAAIAGAKNQLLVEGKEGEGDQFMLGLAGPERLPSNVLADVLQSNEALSSILGPVRFEWAFDGTRTWIVQLHKGGTNTDVGVIVPGDAKKWVVFEVSNGLEGLRSLLNGLSEGSGVIIQGEVGLTSHIADLLRKSKRPSKIEPRLRN
jgi:hypothetical protein